MDKVTYKTSKSELVKVELPEQTSTYKPISHQQLIDLTLNSIQSAGFELETEKYESAREGQIATGRYIIKNIADKEMQLMVGWQNSYNKQVSLKFALGIHIMICSNGSVSGDYGAFKRKHTGDVQEFTPKTIEEYIKGAGDEFIKMQTQRDRMKEIQLTKRVQAELLGRMFAEENIIESTQLNIIKRELAHPTYNYGAPNSMWELMQFTTFAAKDIHPSLWMKEHLAINRFFVSEAGLFVPSGMFNPSPVKADVEVIPANQMNIYDIPGVTEEAVVVETMVETAPEDVDKLPMASRDCFKPTTDEVTTKYQDLM